MSTFVPSGKDIDRKWYVVDASGQTLGRLATKAADVLSGKLNPKYVPYIDMGDHVIVINAEKVRLTGLKSQSKLGRAMGSKLKVYRGDKHPHLAQQPVALEVA